jgi:glycosyltransferase involved in cell wall biosynthesis
LATARPTILQIIPNLDAGGAELSVIEIAHAVVRAGGRALVLAEPGGRLCAKVAAAGGEVIAFPAATKHPLKLVANALALTRFIKEQGVDLAHARSRAPAWSALAAARRAGVAFVTTYHGAYGETNAIKRAYNSVMARGDMVIANSRYTAGLIEARYHTPPGRIVVIHRGVDAAAFDPALIAQTRVAALRAHWGVAPQARIILLAARLAGWKGHTTLIEACARLATDDQPDPVVAVLAGDAQGREAYRQSLLQQIRGLGLEERVRLVGHVDDIAAAYCTAHVTVVASTSAEAFGRSAIEAAAMGCPVIASDLGALPETVRAEPAAPREVITGWLIPPGDAQALAARLTEALRLSPQARAAMATRARRHVLANFTAESMQRATLRVYDGLLGSSLERGFA